MNNLCGYYKNWYVDKIDRNIANVDDTLNLILHQVPSFQFHAMTMITMEAFRILKHLFKSYSSIICWVFLMKFNNIFVHICSYSRVLQILNPTSQNFPTILFMGKFAESILKKRLCSKLTSNILSLFKQLNILFAFCCHTLIQNSFSELV